MTKIKEIKTPRKKIGMHRNENGDLVIWEKTVPLGPGWNFGLNKEELRIVHDHNKKLLIKNKKEREVRKRKGLNKKYNHLTETQRYTILAKEWSKTILDEMEMCTLMTIFEDDLKSIQDRQIQIKGWKDMFNIYKTILEHRDMVLDENGENVPDAIENQHEVDNLVLLEAARKKMDGKGYV